MKFFRSRKAHLKNHMKSQDTLNSQTILKKNKTGELTHSYFKTDYKAIAITAVRYWHYDGYIDQWNRIENPEINPKIYGK